MKYTFFILSIFLPLAGIGQVSDATGLSQANQIKNETVPNANTPTRVGTNFVNIWNSKGNKQEANTWTARQSFTAGASNTGLRFGTKSGSDPSSPLSGEAYFSTTSNQFRGYDGTAFRYFTFNDGINDNRIQLGSGGRLTDDADLTFTGGNTLNAANFSSSGTITVNGSLALPGITNGRVPIISGGLLGSDADLTFSGGNTLNTNQLLVEAGATMGTGTPVTSGNMLTVTVAAVGSSGNVITEAINMRQGVASTGVHFGSYVKAYADHTSGTVNQMLAVQGNAENADAGTVTNLRGILGSSLTTNGPVTNAVGVLAEGVFIAGSATVTNSYGILIGPATAGGGTITNNWGLYQNDATATNVFQGPTILNSGFNVQEGSNERMGVATLVGGTVTVNNTSVTANSRIFLTSQSDGGTPGFVRVSARSASTSFTITSSSGTDTSVIAWLIVQPN